ncbi:ATP-dependent RNA helicase SUV3, mitochondrial isoform X1 [Lycium ferocissimum]|uniref:ATP-dependent RNA helicase SUV3, mitochondrial isoform X1 n=2 Tax=Lycium ferocissimum TaxID=112874 RepID=UPI002815B79B|nr:ATP-dependent RNA helicase SUV3, mitochondrial isoform X1 [Lycium ferocissimum]
MASLLFRRKLSPVSISRKCLSYGGVEYYLLPWNMENEASFGICDCLRQFSSSTAARKVDFTDLTHPHTWYPQARKKNRNVFLHVGPTNSGKTYYALKQLESSSSGAYCGPLRLLAWEVAKRLNKSNVPCDLITGQEREEVEGARHKSVTVEMADVASDYDCAIIDEIQMIGCRSRGFSFTRALLGLAANELHLCGDAAAVPLVQEILKVTGDTVKIQYYERLSPLVPLRVPLGSFSNIRTGDCVVTFSRAEIYRMKKQIEAGGKHRCSVVYGSLPPETRTRQATMFNDASSDSDVLVASDAIGMGLNLNISRIIFSTLRKFDGVEIRDLTVPEIKQIAGRAGRYKSKFSVGEVTCLEADDLPLLHSSLDAPSPVLERAGLFPNFDLLYMYSRLHPKHGLHEILEHFLDNAKLSEHYFIANCEEMLKVAALIDTLPLSLHDKYLFCISPVDMDDDISSQGLTQFATNYSKNGLVRLREIFTPGALKVPKSHTALKELESIHKVLDLYVWLSYRLEESFPDRELAASQKAICSMLIEEFLERLGWQRPRTKRLTQNSKLISLISRETRQHF